MSIKMKPGRWLQTQQSKHDLVEYLGPLEEKIVKKNMTFTYFHVEVIRVIDGDTVELKIDMGNYTFWQDKFRLIGINAPETHSTDRLAANAATAFLVDVLKEEGITVHTKGKDKYGRWLCSIFTSKGNVNLRMVQAGHAVLYDGGKR